MTISIDPQSIKYYYPDLNSPDIEDITLINKMHEIFANYLLSFLEPGYKVTFSENLVVTYSISSLDFPSKRHLFSKGYIKTDCVTVELNIKNIINRINTMREQTVWCIENVTEHKKRG